MRNPLIAEILHTFKIVPKGIKKIAKILFILLATGMFALGTMVALLQCSSVQRYIVAKTTALLSEKLGTKVQIESVDFTPFNKLLLNKVYIADQKADTLFYANQLKVGISPMYLLKKQLVCTSMKISGFYGRFVIDKQNRLNLQFFLDAFKGKEKKELPIVLRFDKISLSDSRISFDNENFTPVNGFFDPKHIYVKHINSEISLHKLSSKYLSVEIKSLSFKEKCGFKLKNFSASLIANKSIARIDGLSIKLPNSSVQFTPITIKYGTLNNLSKFDKINLRFCLDNSTISFADLRTLSPAIQKAHGEVHLSSCFQGDLANIRIKNINLSYNDDLSLRGSLELSGLPNFSETFVYAKIDEIKTDKNKLQDLVSNLIGRPFILPDEMNQLGNMRYKGNISGFFNNLVAYGSLNTNIGTLYTDMMMEVLPGFTGVDYSGSMHANKLKLDKLVNDSSSIGETSFNLASSGKIRPRGDVTGDIKGTISTLVYKKYNYQNILIKGAFDRTGFDGEVNLDDENAKLNFIGKINFASKMPSGKFELNIDKLNLYKLNIAQKYPDLTIGMKATANYEGQNIDKANTNISINNLTIGNSEKEVFIKKLYLSSILNDTNSVLSVNSDIVTGVVKGKYNLSSIAKSLNELIGNYIPSVFEHNSSLLIKKGDNNFIYHFSDFHINEIAEVLNIPLYLSPETSISGFFNNTANKFRMEITSPEIKWKNSHYTNAYFLCNNPDRTLQLKAYSNLNQKSTLQISSQVVNDSVLLSMNWDNPSEFSGNLNTVGYFSRNSENKLIADIDLFPSQIKIKGGAWDISNSRIKTDFKSAEISNFGMQQDNRYIKVDGIASANTTDSLTVLMNDIQLSNLLTIVNLQRPKLEAAITGKCVLMSVFDKMVMNMKVFGKDFAYNDAVWGDVNLTSSWDNVHKRVKASSIVFTPTDTIGYLGGEYYPRKDSLEFLANGKALSIEFLRHYLDGAIQHASGHAVGKMRIFGSLSHILLDGDVYLKDGQFDFDFLKTTYHFSDTIHVRPDGVIFKNIKVFDSEKHSAILNGRLTHKNFDNLRYNFTIDCKNLLGLNTTEKDNSSFHGKAYGTGRVRIQGTSSKVAFDMNLRADANTKIVIPMGNNGVATENTFIQFINKPDSTKTIELKNKKETNTETNNKTNITLKLQVEATPDAEVVLITDPVGGDMVRSSGRGNLRLDYDNNGALKLYGNFEVEKGEYIFTLQQVVRKTFSIRNGGTIRWTGNPYLALINLDAAYTVPSVSLLDILDETQLDGVARTSVPVNCLLNLTGDLMQPTIKFDLELPSDAEIQRRIKSIVNTDEMMNREILALLVMSRFYKPDYLQNNKTGLGTEMVSILTTTVSGQLNGWLSQLSNKFNMGVNARLGNGQDFTEGGEYEVALMYQPNNRLIINSNVGYRNDIMNTTNSNFIGDLDIEYKLNKSGKLRAKAYTHSADNYYINNISTAKTTQGVGLLYREDFNTFPELMRYYFSRKNKNIETKPEKKQKK